MYWQVWVCLGFFPPGPVNNTRFLSAVFGQFIPYTCAHQRQLLFRPLSFFPFHCLCASVLPVMLLNNKIGDLEIGKVLILKVSNVRTDNR